MKTLTETALLCDLSMRQWTARKIDKKVNQEIEQRHNATNAGNYNKLLIAEEAIKAYTQITGKARTFHYTNTLPWRDQGARIMMSTNYFEYLKTQRQNKTDWENAVNIFFQNYPTLKLESKNRLGGLWNEEDYPSLNTIKGKFLFEISFSPIETPDFRVKLPQIEIDKMIEETEERLNKRLENAMAELWQRVYDPLNHLITTCQDPNAKFKNSIIGNLAELVNLLPRLNLTDDPNLEKARQEIEKRIVNIDPDDLRTDPNERSRAVKDAKEILDQMNQARQAPAPEPEPEEQQDPLFDAIAENL